MKPENFVTTPIHW